VSVTVTEAGADDDSGGPALVLPMRVDGNQLATVPQGSIAELVQAIRLVLTTRPGERLVEPDFGSEDWTFAPGVDASAIEADHEQQEPRARVEVEVTPAGARAHIDVTVTTEES
jgi:phage baseplate assembly protein W